MSRRRPVSPRIPLAHRCFSVTTRRTSGSVSVRRQGEPDLLLRHLLPQVTSFAQQLIEAGQIRALVIDTYERELEGYGESTALTSANGSSMPTASRFRDCWDCNRELSIGPNSRRSPCTPC